MRARKHARRTAWDRLLDYSGIIATVVVVALLLIALALGGPSPRY